MNFNRELLNNLVARNGALKIELILVALRPLAEKYSWSFEQLAEVSLAVAGVIHESEMQLAATVDELMKDLVNNRSRA